MPSKKSKAKKRRKLQKRLEREGRVSVTVNLAPPKRPNALVRLVSRFFGLAAALVGLFHV